MAMFSGDSTKEDHHRANDQHNSEAVIDPALRSLASSPAPDKKKHQQHQQQHDSPGDSHQQQHPTDHSSMPLRVEQHQQQQTFQMASSPFVLSSPPTLYSEPRVLNSFSPSPPSSFVAYDRRTRHFVDSVTNSSNNSTNGSSHHRLGSPPPPIATMSTSTSTSTDPHSHSPSPSLSVSVDRSSNSTPHIRRSPPSHQSHLQQGQGQVYQQPTYDGAPSSMITSQSQSGRHHSSSGSSNSNGNNSNSNGHSNANGRQADSQPVAHGGYIYSNSTTFEQHPQPHPPPQHRYEHHPQHHDARGPPIYAVPPPPFTHPHPYALHPAHHQQATHHPHHPVQHAPAHPHQHHQHHQPLSHHPHMSSYEGRSAYPSTLMQGAHGHGGGMGGQGPVPIVLTDDAATKLTDGIRRRCFNCCTTDTSTWRRSNLSPGKVLCNKCGLFERTHSRPRPDQFPHKRGPLAGSTLGAASSIGGGPSSSGNGGGVNRRTPPGANQLPPISAGAGGQGPYQYHHQSLAPLSTGAGEYAGGVGPGQGGVGQGTTLPGLGAWHGNSSGGSGAGGNGGAGGASASASSGAEGNGNGSISSNNAASAGGPGAGDNQSNASSTTGTPLLPSSRRSTLDSHGHNSPRLSPRERERDFHDSHPLSSNAADKHRQPPSPPLRASTGLGQLVGEGGRTPPA